jgi:hypothetical protein
MKEKEYKKLPGRGRKRGKAALVVRTRASLWLGRDHLLCRYNTGYTEEYKRFYYRDIQAFATAMTNRGRNLGILFLACFLISTAFALKLAYGGGLFLFAFEILAGLFLALLLINWLRGPTCRCYLMTAVSREELPSLDRVKKVKKAIGILNPIIERLQGSLTPGEIEAKAKEMPQKATPVRAAPSAAGAAAGKHYSGTAHGVLLVLLLADGLLTSAALFNNHFALTISSTLVISGIGIMTVVALVKQHGSSITKGLRGITWAALGYMCVALFLGYVLSIYAAMNNPMAINSQWEMIKMFSALSPLDSAFLTCIYVFSIVSSLLIGTLGMIFLRRFRKEYKAPPRMDKPMVWEKA